MKNFFRGNKLNYEDVILGMKSLKFLYHLDYMNEEKDHVVNYIINLEDETKKEYICNNISLFNRTLNKYGLSTDIIHNMFAYIGFIGLIEKDFSLLQGLDIKEIVLLSSYVYNFITHKEYPENLRLPFLSEKMILSTIVEREPNNLQLQMTILDSVDHSFSKNDGSNVINYVTSMTDDQVALLRGTENVLAAKGVAF